MFKTFSYQELVDLSLAASDKGQDVIVWLAAVDDETPESAGYYVYDFENLDIEDDYVRIDHIRIDADGIPYKTGGDFSEDYVADMKTRTFNVLLNEYGNPQHVLGKTHHRTTAEELELD